MKRKDTVTNLSAKRVSFTVLPGINFSSSSGVKFTASANLDYFASNDLQQKLSQVYSTVSYSLKKQTDLVIYSTIWTRQNNLSFQGNAWYLQNSESTYGLGSMTGETKQDILSYNFIRFYESVLKKIHGNIFGGVGYKLDYHTSIKERGNKDGSVSDYAKYGSAKQTVSSGLSLDFLFDSRRNSINPPRGSYLYLTYSPKSKSLNSDNNWNYFQLDGRKYFNLPAKSNNILAFWSLLNFTKGHAPYLDLPSTGWDYQQRSGRGYLQGRYRGKNMLYFESEYRFKLISNGLLGAVVFANAQSFSEIASNQYKTILPAAGAGLRIKLDKRSGLNASLDYGIGKGSNGIFFNVGETF